MSILALDYIKLDSHVPSTRDGVDRQMPGVSQGLHHFVEFCIAVELRGREWLRAYVQGQTPTNLGTAESAYAFVHLLQHCLR